MYVEKEKLEDIVEILLSFEFTKSQIKRLLCNTKRNIGDLTNLRTNYEYYHKKMVSLGYSEYEIHEVACKFPKVINFRFCSGHLKEDYDEYIKTLPQEQEDDENIYFEFNKIRKILTDLGLSKKRLDFIFSQNTETIFMDPNVIEQTIKFYHSCGLTNANLVTLLNHHSTILEYDESTYEESLKRMVQVGLTREDFGKIIMNIAKARRILSNKEFVDFLDFIESKPFDYSKLRKQLVKQSSVITQGRDALESGFANIMNLGFTEKETGDILSDALSTIVMSYDNLSYKLRIPTYVGCTIEEARKIVHDYPGYLTQGPENLIAKFKVYHRRNLLDFIVKKPKNIIQNAELTDARCEYLNTYYPWLKEPAYSRMVFTSEDAFTNRFNGNNEYIKKLLRDKKEENHHE